MWRHLASGSYQSRFVRAKAGDIGPLHFIKPGQGKLPIASQADSAHPTWFGDSTTGHQPSLSHLLPIAPFLNVELLQDFILDKEMRLPFELACR